MQNYVGEKGKDRVALTIGLIDERVGRGA